MILFNINTNERPYGAKTYTLEIDKQMLEAIGDMLKPLLKQAAFNDDDILMIDIISAKTQIKEILKGESKDGQQDNNG